jgi:hypothetical protein
MNGLAGRGRPVRASRQNAGVTGRRALLVLLFVLLATGALGWWVAGDDAVQWPDAPKPDDEPTAVLPTAVDSGAPEHRPRVAPVVAKDEVPLRISGPDRLLISVVTAFDDEPVAGARARLLRAIDGDDARLDVAAETITSTDGTFSFDASGGWVRVDADGYAPVLVPHSDWYDEIRLWPWSEHTLRVIDAYDQPVPSAVAHTFTERGFAPIAAVPADDSGTLAFRAGDDQEVSVAAPGYATVWIENLGEWAGADVVLHPGASIEGIVVTPEGEPVANATVTLDVDGVGGCVTGADGRFTFDGLARSSWPHEISVEWRHELRASMQARVGAQDVRIVLAPPAVIHGRVLRADGSPPIDAELELPEGGHATSPLNGSFVAGVPPGRMRLTARMPRDTGVGEHPDTRGELGFVDLDLAPGEEVEGVEIRMERVPASYAWFRVEGPDGRRFHGYGLSYDDAHDRGFQRRHGTTAAGEWWRLSVPAGTPVELSFTTARDDDVADDFEATVVTRAQPAGEPDVVRAPSASEGLVQLTVTTVRTDGVAIPEDADVNWLVASRNPERVRALPAGAPPTGVVHVPRGEALTVLAWADGCGTLELAIPPLDGPTASFQCRLPPEAVVHGQLVTRTGRPVTRAHVEVLVTRPDGTESLSEASFDQLLQGGEFLADQLSGGRGRITVRDSERRIVAEQTFELREEGRLELGDVVVGALPLARGTVTARGQPVSGAGIRASDGEQWFGHTSTIGNGAFAVAVPRRPGSWLEVVADPGTIRYDLADVLDGSPVHLRADAPGTLSLVVEEFVASIDVRLPGGPRVRPETLIRIDDHFTLGGIPAGPVEVTLRCESGTVLRGNADVVAGDTVRVPLTPER